jgi:hypothetical protein
VDTCLRVLVPEGEEPIDQKETASSALLQIERAEETTPGSFRTRARSDVLENLCPKCGIQMDKAEADRWRKIAGRGDYPFATCSDFAANIQVYPLCGLG